MIRSFANLPLSFAALSLALASCDPGPEIDDEGASTTAFEFADESESASESESDSGYEATDETSPDSEEETTLAESEHPRGDEITEVSPELFAQISQWTNDSNEPKLGLEEYIRANSPALLDEAQTFIAGHNKKGLRGACVCNILASVDANPSVKTVQTNSNWSTEADGAAHRGDAYRSASHAQSEAAYSQSNHTAVSLQLVCLDEQAQYCNASCAGKMYVYSEYGTRLYGWADTGGIWSKAAQAAVADGAKLTYDVTHSTPLVLFEKVGSVSHQAKSTSFNPDEIINTVRNALAIAVAVKTSGAAGVDSDLITKTIRSLAKLISRSGTNGNTQNEMFVAYDSRALAPFNVSFSPLGSQVHRVKLTTQANTKNRGWGGKNADRSRFSSGYTLAVAVDYFQCTGAAAPLRGGVWRYAGTTDAPYSSVTLRNMTQSFFDVMGINVNAQQPSGKTW